MSHKVWLYHDIHEPDIFDSDEIEDLGKEGWRDAPGKVDSTPEDIELEALKTEADDLGIKVDGRSTVSSLTKLINKRG